MTTASAFAHQHRILVVDDIEVNRASTALTGLGGIEARARSHELGLAAHIARPLTPHARLREIEQTFSQQPAAERPDPWQRELYDELVTRLGSDRIHGFLGRLASQLRNLLAMLADDAGDDVISHAAHDAASVAGTFGFIDVTRRCRELLETQDGDTRVALVDALECAVTRLDGHLKAHDSLSVVA